VAENKKPKKRKWLRTVAYNVVVVLLIFSGMELYLNAQLNDPADAPQWLQYSMRKYYEHFDRNIIQFDPNCAQYDSTLFYTLKPGTSTFSNREFSNVFTVNSKGLRDDEEDLFYPKIIVLGDSYTMGWGVDQELTYSELLQTSFKKPVLNTGISSYGTAREITMLEQINTDSLELLIVQYCPNDLPENQRYVYNNHQLNVSSAEDYALAQSHTQDGIAYYPFKHVVNFAAFLTKSSPHQIQTPEPTTEVPVVVDSSKLIGAGEAFISILEQTEAILPTTRIVVFSLEAQKTDAFFIHAVKESLDKQFATSLHDRVSYLDLSGKIDSTHRFVMDPHLNAEGHQVIAAALEEHIAQLPNGYTRKHWLYDSAQDTAITCTYWNGYKEGLFKTYWPSGKLSSSSTYHKGVKEGIASEYYESGVLKRVVNYSNDRLVDLELRYDSTGLVTHSIWNSPENTPDF